MFAPDMPRRATTRKLPTTTAERNALQERAPDAWFNLHEASAHTGIAPKSLRNMITAGKLAPDGRGPKRSPLFRRATLDAFLASRAGGRS
jgi:hypothetical protein